jgi:hypothetical protein
MKGKNIIKAPFLQTPSSLVYSITLLSGHIVTSPAGFGVDIESVVPTDVSVKDSTRHLEDYELGANGEQVRNTLRRVATKKKS